MRIKLSFFRQLSNHLWGGSVRSALAKRNAIGSLFIKGGSIVISFLLVRVTLHYLNEYEYGVWLTLSSILMWLNYFDIGLGHGLRNKLGEAIALQDATLAKGYVSTAFFMLGITALVMFVVILLLYPFLDWARILNIPSDLVPHLNVFVLLLIGIFLLKFALKSIGLIYVAHMLTIVNSLLVFGGSALSLAAIYLLVKWKGHGSIVEVGLIFTAAPIIVYLLFYHYTFYISYPELAPSFRYFRKIYFHGLFHMGVQFFVIQIAGLVLFSTSNLLISHMFSPSDVTPYNIAYRYFSAAFMLFGTIVSPLWAAVTNAYVKNDFRWLRNAIRKLLLLWIFTCMIVLVMLGVAPFVYRWWLSRQLDIPFGLSAMMALYVIIMTFGAIFSAFINGTGKIRLQLYGSCAQIVIYPLLAILLGHHLGLTGIIGALCLCMFLSNLFLYAQYRKLINRTACGVWNR